MSPCWRTCASTRERPAKDDAERAAFAAKLAAFGDAFVSDGFGVVHRKQASVYELATALPSAAGTLIATELDVLDRLTENPERPYAVVLGGSKVSDKLGVIGHLLPRVNFLLIGGGMLFTFLAALGHKVGLEPAGGRPDRHRARATWPRPRSSASTIVLPRDVVVASKFGADAEHVVRPIDAIEDTEWGSAGLGLDIGPETGRAVLGVHPRCTHGVLERPDGRLRARAVRGRHSRRSPRRSPRSTASASSAEATRRPPCAPSGSPTTSSVTFRPVAVRASSSSRASTCRVWRSSDGSSEQFGAARAAHRRQLEDEPRSPAGDRVRPEAGVDAQGRRARLLGRRGRGLPAVHRPAQRADARRRGQAPDRVRRSGCVRARVGRVHR